MSAEDVRARLCALAARAHNAIDEVIQLHATASVLVETKHNFHLPLFERQRNMWTERLDRAKACGVALAEQVADSVDAALIALDNADSFSDIREIPILDTAFPEKDPLDANAAFLRSFVAVEDSYFHWMDAVVTRGLNPEGLDARSPFQSAFLATLSSFLAETRVDALVLFMAEDADSLTAAAINSLLKDEVNGACRPEFVHALLSCDLVGLWTLGHSRADPSLEASFPLRRAAKVGSVPVVSLLLEDGRADPAALCGGALVDAVKGGHREIVQLLLKDRRATPNADMLLKACNKLNAAIKEQASGARGWMNIPAILEDLLADRRADPAREDLYPIALDKIHQHTNPAWIAAKWAAVKLLVKDGRAHLSERSLGLIAESKQVDLFRELLADDVRTTAKMLNHSLLYARATSENFKLLLSDARVNPATDNSAIFSKEYVLRNNSMLALLLQDGRANPDAITPKENVIFYCTPAGLQMILNDGRFNPADIRPKLALESLTLEKLELLLKDRRFDPSCQNNFLLRNASMHNTSMLCMLLEDGRADPALDNSDLLRDALRHCEANVFKLLLADRRADPRKITCLDVDRAMNYKAHFNARPLHEMLIMDGRVGADILGKFFE